MSQITKIQELNRICLDNFSKLIVVVFYSEWHAPSQEFLNSIKALSKLQVEPLYAYVDADKASDVAKNFQIQLTPTVLFIDATKKVLLKLEDPTPADVIEAIDEQLKIFNINYETTRVRVFDQIDNIFKAASPVHVFMKGSPQEPKCGFSSKLVDILDDFQLNYSHFDILSNSEVRDWLRVYGNWKTYPQVWINNKLVGGLDVVKQLVADNKFRGLLPQESLNYNAKARLDRAAKRSPVLLVTNGSSDISDKLFSNGIKFTTLDAALEPVEFLEYLKGVSAESLPHLYVSQTLYGGADKINAALTSGDIYKVVPQSEYQLNSQQKLEFLLRACDVVVFITSNISDLSQETQDYQLIKLLQGRKVQYEFFNVEADQELKTLVQNSSKVSTFPQVFFEKKYFGGLDVIQDLDKKEVLTELFKQTK